MREGIIQKVMKITVNQKDRNDHQKKLPIIKVSKNLKVMRGKKAYHISLINPLRITLMIHNHMITIQVNWKIQVKLVKKMYRILIID